MSVKGGMRAATSAKLIFNANANGMRKNTSRNNSGGRMMSQRPEAFIFMLTLDECLQPIVRDKLSG